MIDIYDRVRNKQYYDKIMPAEQAARLIQAGDKIGVSGFTPAGYPKVVPLALAKRIEKEHFQIDLFSGSSTGDECDGALARVHGIRSRYPYQTTKELRQEINTGSVVYEDMHLSNLAQQIREGFFGRLQYAVIEAAAITEEGDIVPTTSVGNSPTFAAEAEHVIVEVNVTQPAALEGLHDIYVLQDPPHRTPIPLIHAGDRIGKTAIPCGWKKIAAIVPSAIPDAPRFLKAVDEDAEAMSAHLIDFLEQEVADGRLPKHLLPLQSGVGSVSNAVIGGLKNSPFTHLSIFTEVIQDGMFDLIDAGKVDTISGTALSVSPSYLKKFYDHLDQYKNILVLRPQEISNNPGLARRLGVIAMNTAIECDIYGNVNSTHFYGTKMMNGIGGSGDFARSAYLSIFCTNSLAKQGKVSSIVPMCSHVDHTEHDVQILCTEQGIADLRGLSPKERARVIIDQCAHPRYRDMLNDYFDRAVASTRGAQTPHLLPEALSWHQRFLDTGTMECKSK